jgi:hypothetical protein
MSKPTKRGEYYVDKLNSFALGNPDIKQAWMKLIMQMEEEGNDCIVFVTPKQQTRELIIMVEKLLRDKIK